MRLLTAFTAAALVAGCATNPPSGPIDPQALGGAIAIDDVGYVRARVEAKAITVNDSAPGIGYDAAPMITVAAPAPVKTSDNATQSSAQSFRNGNWSDVFTAGN